MEVHVKDEYELEALKVEIEMLHQKVEALEAEIERRRAHCQDLLQAKSDAYIERNRLVAALAHIFPAGIAKTTIEGWDAEWHNCVFIETPVGQMSWHYHDSQAMAFMDLLPYWGTWDGHTTEEKYERLARLKDIDFITTVKTLKPHQRKRS
jgi:hypothetical protein